MSIAIHHGPPGSYKTSGAIADFVVKAAMAGKVLVTNVRGLDDESRFHKYVKGDIPEEFEIINIDTTTEKGRNHFRCWYQWAPKGALIFFDEINTIYPKHFSQRDLREYDYPDGPDAATKDDRPPDVLTAFEMHRHHNWDIVATSPSWKKVHPALQDCAEGGYRHVNRAMIGIRGSYNEVFHLADNSGAAKGDEITVTTKRVPKNVFNLYKSTATGKVADTSAGRNVFLRSGPIAFFLAFVTVVALLINQGLPKILQKAFAGTEEIASTSARTQAQFTTSSAPLSPVQYAPKQITWLEQQSIVQYVGHIGLKHLFYIGTTESTYTYTKNELARMGVDAQIISNCIVLLQEGTYRHYAHCPSSPPEPGRPSMLESARQFL